MLMKDFITTKRDIENAIRSLYQMIMAVDGQTHECRVIDHNRELQNISTDVSSFDEFCDKLYINIHPEDREGFRAFTDPDCFPKELKSNVFTSFECRIRQKNSQYYWSEIIFCNATKEDSSDGTDYLFLIRDVHRWKTKEIKAYAEQRFIINSLKNKYDELFEENMRDEQTGCYNRKGLKYYTNMVLDNARETGNYVFVCVADLNGLKHINDTYGHAAGDEAIAAVSSELLKAAPGGSKIIRTGGDEFLLIASLDKDCREPYEMSAKIDDGLMKYNKAHPNPFTIGASYGWILSPVKDDMVDLDDYIETADAKMYEMKVERDKYRRG
ncbi:MAG: sensor domain-containing diguanylate cyclase [Lachnospiraceae bacterium]|nr:sensor domain-containing diguanylate cyclase [Lachnospiraceae bacterium]